jgi:hypothetical protein
MAILHVGDIEVANAQPPPKNVHIVRSAPPAGRTCLTTLPHCAAQAGTCPPQPTRSMLVPSDSVDESHRRASFRARAQVWADPPTNGLRGGALLGQP